MKGGKSSATPEEVGRRLKRVVAGNLVKFTLRNAVLIVVYMYVVVYIQRHEFLPTVITKFGMLIGSLAFYATWITLPINLTLIAHIDNRHRFLKYRLRWKMAAPLLLLQPRAYPLMIQFMKLVDDVETGAEGKGEGEDSLV